MDGSGLLEFPECCTLIYKKLSDTDLENELKETFRVFRKDDEGIPSKLCVCFSKDNEGIPSEMCVYVFSKDN